MKKNFLILMLAFVLMIALVGCDNFMNGDTNQPDNSNNSIINNEENKGTQKEEKSGEQMQQNKEKDESGEMINGDSGENQLDKNPIVTLNIKDYGVIKLELYPEIAPETVKNFVGLIESGFYDGLIFHRIIPGFMNQGGDPLGNGTGGPGYGIKGEFAANNVVNNISHVKGVISMARGEDPNSGGSQFFIVSEDSLHLDGMYAGFGKVIEGIEVVDAMANTEIIRTDFSKELLTDYEKAGNPVLKPGMELYDRYVKESLEIDRPVNPPVIASATVETFGIDYGEPVRYEE